MKTNSVKKILIIVTLFLFASPFWAKVKLPTILGDNMVLQQQTDVKLWGEAAAGKKVTVKPSWTNKVYTVQADQTGKWLLALPTPKAGGPYDIRFKDNEETLLKNILIGEVWFCSGQSNMEMPMKGFDGQPVGGANDLIAKAGSSAPIRIYTTDSQNGSWVRQFSKQPQTDCKGAWLENTSDNVANTSAVAYFFARYIQEALEVPVGLVISTWGGSRVEAWMSREAIEPFKEFDLSILANDDEVKTPTATPCVLYNAKIAPLTNFAIRGFLWYQGESNRHNVERYEELTPVFVKDLRAKWNRGEFPFYFVQIAPYNYENANGISAARLREAQFRNMKDIPNSGMVTTLDAGNPVSIHPVNKEVIGSRLAYWALAKTYNKEGFGYSGPLYNSMEIADNKIYINFDYAERGFYPLPDNLKGFEVAGEDRVFYPANVEKGNKITNLAVSSPEVPHPVAVRYAYKNYIEASLLGMNGISAAPFRTDNW
ncbi:hypothetical protein EZS27_013292 [termite gut metagenome]|uniref:Sialate O-acetylesterase domain-containing protein n=1 Tax=termite gut metagenome TaxID=433724 RepID=A0A5J4RY87_9ZZZZ